VLRKGKGAAPKATNSVTVHYEGWLDGGRVFDSSYKRNDRISFPLNGVIKGWTEGLQLVSTGGMIELEIPSKLGYGERGAGGAGRCVPTPPCISWSSSSKCSEERLMVIRLFCFSAVLLCTGFVPATEPPIPLTALESQHLGNPQQVTLGLPRAGEGYFSADGK